MSVIYRFPNGKYFLHLFIKKKMKKWNMLTFIGFSIKEHDTCTNNCYIIVMITLRLIVTISVFSDLYILWLILSVSFLLDPPLFCLEHAKFINTSNVLCFSSVIINVEPNTLILYWASYFYFFSLLTKGCCSPFFN